MSFIKTLFPIIILIMLLVLSCSQAGTDSNRSKQKEYNETVIYSHEYNCFTVTERCGLDIVKLINRDTLIYVSSEESFRKYEEIRGTLKQINDSIYYVKCFKHILFDISEDHGFKDSLLFVCDSNLIHKNITIEYQNKEKERYKIYTIQNHFFVNKNYFNNNDDQIKIDVGYPHPIIDENVMLFGSYGGASTFHTDNYFHDFYIAIDSSTIKSINIAQRYDNSYGPIFNLKRLTINGLFSRGRKLR